ncbi:hypothetical protein IQ274_32495 [Nostoc sp. LEGE 12447]|uniref:hypothetical protein n=1 Tax=Nostoc sp. LEGE 12447 TaxID=1828640 RepID=UPI001883CC7A|nr:hypothetical protein [Nostoc sp. LEGE 12447]MBE9002778.1 hypothetical protein [Nostoc sp. LEGE 12447]
MTVLSSMQRYGVYLTRCVGVARRRHRFSADLMTENSVSGVEIKAAHEGESSAALVPSAEK